MTKTQRFLYQVLPYLICALFGIISGLAACTLPECSRWGKQHVEAYDETEPRVPLCAVYKCGAKTVHHEAKDEPVCLEFK